MNTRFAAYVFWTLAGAGLLLLLGLPPLLDGDSMSQINGAVYRPPLYQMFLKVTHALSATHGLRLAVVSQTLFTGYAALHLSRSLRAAQMVSPVAQSFVVLLTLGLGSVFHFTNGISSESLGYPLVVLYFSHITRGLHAKRIPWQAFVTLGLCVVTRLQYAWLAAALVVAAALGAISARRWGRLALAIAFSLCIPLLYQTAASKYNETFNAAKVSTNLTGAYALANAIFIAENATIDALRDVPEQQALARDLFTRTYQRGMLWSQWNGGISPEGFRREYFEGEMMKIYDDIFFSGKELGFVPPSSQGDLDSGRAWYEYDALCKATAFSLLKASGEAYVRHVVRKVTTTRFSLSIFAALFLLSAIILYTHRPSTPSALAITAALTLFANYGMFAIIHIIIPRYTIMAEAFFCLATALYLWRLMDCTRGRNPAAS